MKKLILLFLLFSLAGCSSASRSTRVTKKPIEYVIAEIQTNEGYSTFQYIYNEVFTTGSKELATFAFYVQTFTDATALGYDTLETRWFCNVSFAKNKDYEATNTSSNRYSSNSLKSIDCDILSTVYHY